MGAMMREYRQEQRQIWKRQYELKNRTKVYVVSKYAGDVDRNVASAVKACRFVIRNRKMPIASHLLYPQMLDDTDAAQREIGTMYGMALLALCDEVWIFRENGEMSDGMAAEEREARRLGRKIRYFDLEEVE